MRGVVRTRRLIIGAALAVVVVLVAVVGALAYDYTRRDAIAEGIRLGGVELGGMDADAARAELARQLLPALRKPVAVTWEGRRFVLGSREAGVAIDLDRAVEAAIERGREGFFLTRAARDLTGGELDEDLRAEVIVSRGAVRRFVARVTTALDRAPRDATVEFAAGTLEAVPARRGVEVRARRLRRGVLRALTSAHGDRVVAAQARTLAPKVRTSELVDRYETVITVDRGTFQLRLWKRLELEKTYRIAVGAAGLDTPAGLYAIQNKQIDPTWHVPDSDWAGDLAGKVIPPGPKNPIKARWMGIYDGAGIHGTDAIDSLGTAASHGCVRMAIPDVIELYDRTPVGATVYIA
jgi:lipoprotein-anchoring transpeptidase ErfK/SrfK